METDPYVHEAHRLIDQVLSSAIRRLESEGLVVHSEDSDTVLSLTREQTLQLIEENKEDFDVQNIEWLKIEEFSVEKGEEKINEFIKTWDYHGAWLSCVDFLSKDEHEFDTRYRYRVRWSIPTRRKPIPRATACVYFTFVVSKIKPKDYPVDVYYVFETNRLVHRPGHSRFREKWLKDIIDTKVAMIEAVDF